MSVDERKGGPEEMKARSFGKLSDGRKAGLYILRNENGVEASVTDFGATLVSLYIPGADSGAGRDVVLGFSDVSGYEFGHGSLGATIGRFANRIGGAAFTIGGKRYELTANNGPNALHGGRDPYSRRLWQVKIPFATVNSGDIAVAFAAESIGDGRSYHAVDKFNQKTITFFLDSPDGDQGFPGDLHVEVTYTLTDSNELHIDYSAVSSADTPLNLTNHSYFNLNGHDSGSVLGQYCEIRAGRFTPVDEHTLPTGEIRSVAGTPMDFRTAKKIGADIGAADEQLQFCGGYDHNFIPDGEGRRLVATMYSEDSGIRMSVITDLPGMQVYTANGLNSDSGKGGCVYRPYSGICFETQFWPDAVNHEDFPGGILKAGEEFHSRTTYHFQY